MKQKYTRKKRTKSKNKSRKKNSKPRTSVYKGFNFYDSHKFLKYNNLTLKKPLFNKFSARTLIYPYDYREIVDKGIGSIDSNLYGREVAILGAGAAGLCAAHELMRVGLKPVIYEPQDRLGGRLYDYKFPGDKKAWAPLGAMRFSRAERTFYEYLNKFGLKTNPFPDPFSGVNTTVNFQGKTIAWKPGEPIPEFIKHILKKWNKTIGKLKKRLYKANNSRELLQIWKKMSEQLYSKTYYEYLLQEGWTHNEIETFRVVGVGSGGFGALFSKSILDVLEFDLWGFETKQRLVIGGAEQLTDNLWNKKVKCVHWGTTSIANLNKNKWHGGVTKILNGNKKKLRIGTKNNKFKEYDYVICAIPPHVLQMKIEIDNNIFTTDIWAAIRQKHMANAIKIWVRTKDAFWKKEIEDYNKGKTDKIPFCTTSTDLATNISMPWSYPDTKSGAVLLSYVLDSDNALKWLSMTEKQQIDKCVEVLDKIYGRDVFKDQIQEVKVMMWTLFPYNMGSWSDDFPGTIYYTDAVYNQAFTTETGLFLAGDWCSKGFGGWVDGALTSGLNASLSLINKMGGQTNKINVNMNID